eukprot:CAMPEP_0181169580 /NCGR_PEP_ID=MMETSP1096-20121128/891_1 /TAXON_ID=156174 ORGANISM="Chrysochromulina ericina, Strain CCMP281" /NCGR_SAMPLE_ID=MMETSP1096 /ASSEMBLY_ACC=CAM_ASM_000453 /LENGTH=93 /DNA_ID=CAMNT_0023257049 /DNA_START=1058 /DNA_END=1336 /DNA_ORIENTATION=-
MPVRSTPSVAKRVHGASLAQRQDVIMTNSNARHGDGRCAVYGRRSQQLMHMFAMPKTRRDLPLHLQSHMEQPPSCVDECAETGISISNHAVSA